MVFVIYYRKPPSEKIHTSRYYDTLAEAQKVAAILVGRGFTVLEIKELKIYE